MKMFCAALFIATAAAAQAATCTATFEVVTEEAHGALPAGSALAGTLTYDEGEALRMGNETMSYLASGLLRVRAPDGSEITGVVRAIHLVRTPHFADYVSFDAKGVEGDLGGVRDYEDPMLVTLFAPRGSLTSFELPKDTDGWEALSKRRVFQVHTPDTMWTLPGKVIGLEAACE